MARPAPAVARTVALVSFLARHAGQAYTLTELSRELGINKATMHGMAAGLVDAGWIVRDSEKRYRVGPGLVAVAASAAHPQQLAVDAAREPMRALADELDVRCVATTVIGRELVILAVEGPPPPAGIAAEVGYRAPLAPPLGATFVAWADPETVEAWLADPEVEPGGRQRYEQALASVRRHGFELSRPLTARARVTDVLVELSRGMPSRRALGALRDLLRDLEHDEEERIVLDVERDAVYEGSFLSAPVFDESGHVLLTIGLVDPGTPLTGAELLERAGRLVDATRRVTAAVGGRAPGGATTQRGKLRPRRS